MYIPDPFRQDSAEKLIQFMRANSFATLVSILNGMPFASHLPLATVTPLKGVLGIRILGTGQDGVTLVGHLAKANPHWQAFDQGETLAIFTGPHAYISPSHYENRESVPTWNYVAVHAYGTPRPISFADSEEELELVLATLIKTYEAAYQAQWEALSAQYRGGMLQGIVGFKMPVKRLEGKYKLSQNRSQTDQIHVAQALEREADPATAVVGQMMKANLAIQAQVPSDPYGQDEKGGEPRET